MTTTPTNTSSNAEPQPPLQILVVEADFCFSFAALCRACGVDGAPLLALVNEGVLLPQGPQNAAPQDWVFDATALRTARTALRLDADLQLGPAATALVLDLLAEIAALRTRLQRAGLGVNP